MVDTSHLFTLLSLISVTSSIILTGTVICDRKEASGKNLTATLTIGTIKDDKLHDNGQHVMMLNHTYWVGQSEYLLRVETTKSWVFQDEVSLQIKVQHNCGNSEYIVCYYLDKKSDFNVVRCHIRLDEETAKTTEFLKLDPPTKCKYP